MILVLSYIVLFLYSIAILLIFFYSLAQFNLLLNYLKSKKNTQIIEKFDFANADEIPLVTIQLPIYNEKYVAKEDLAPQIADTMAKVAVGTIIAPYVDGSTYKIAKLINKQVVPDSVKARHILRRVEQQADPAIAQAQYNAANSLIDSLLKELNAGRANFDSLAAKYGEDGTSTKGGDLGVLDLVQWFLNSKT